MYNKIKIISQGTSWVHVKFSYIIQIIIFILVHTHFNLRKNIFRKFNIILIQILNYFFYKCSNNKPFNKPILVY